MHGLRATLRVNNGQSAVQQTALLLQKTSRAIRATMLHRFEKRLHNLRIKWQAQNSSDCTHVFQLLSTSTAYADLQYL
jgi:hypothetical protein